MVERDCLIKMKKELIISLYDRDISWISKLNPDVSIKIYRKGNLTNHPNEIYLENNIGRDVHTFFYHIVSQYKNLADYTFFSQDYPFDHIENYTDIINGNVEFWNEKASQHFEEYWGYHWNSIGTMWNLQQSNQFGGKILTCDKTGSGSWVRPLNLENSWKLFFKCECPEFFEFTPGAHFSISKNQIKLRSLTFYKKVLEFLENVDDAPYVIERFEPYIFNSTIK